MKKWNGDENLRNLYQQITGRQWHKPRPYKFMVNTLQVDGSQKVLHFKGVIKINLRKEEQEIEC